jgi:arylsulfatase A-like enzyme
VSLPIRRAKLALAGRSRGWAPLSNRSVIETHDPKVPFFLDLSFNAPHAPYQARPRPISSAPSRQVSAAQISAMDDQIGQVVKALDARGMRDTQALRPDISCAIDSCALGSCSTA